MNTHFRKHILKMIESESNDLSTLLGLRHRHNLKSEIISSIDRIRKSKNLLKQYPEISCDHCGKTIN